MRLGLLYIYIYIYIYMYIYIYIYVYLMCYAYLIRTAAPRPWQPRRVDIGPGRRTRPPAKKENLNRLSRGDFPRHPKIPGPNNK